MICKIDLSNLILPFVSLLVLSCSQSSEPIVIVTFDHSFEKWIKEGKVFGEGPVKETMGYYGEAHLSSLNELGEPSTGRLTSPEFRIERNYIHFLLGAREIDFINEKGDMSIELLLNGKVVRSKKPEEFHAVFHAGWNVSEFKGTMVQIRVVDEGDRPFAYLDVDHIVQNDIPLEGIVAERIIEMSSGTINIPIKENAPRYYFEIHADGRLIRAFDAPVALTDDIDFWVKHDIYEWSGEQIKVRIYQYFKIEPEILNNLVLSDGLIDTDNLYQENLRHQFHFTAKRGWLNDPNGLVFYEGEYHLFYQANPYGNDYNKTWGHAVSKDLVHWKELPAAINPDHLGSIYSGSAVIDHNNSTGFGLQQNLAMVALHTSVGTRNRWSLGKPFTQSVAYSLDNGRTFTKYDGNLVFANLGYINRGPKAFWYEAGHHWVIVMYRDHGAFVFFTSDDLKEWKQQSTIEIEDLGISEVAAFEDCPELFELPIDGNPENTKWALCAGSGDYVLGDFDGKKFIPEEGLLKYNHSDYFYASQTFNNVPTEDGRRIQMAWGTVDFPEMPFNQMMLFPVSLTLRNTTNGVRMFANPVNELEKLYDSMKSYTDIRSQPGEDLLECFNSGSYDISMDVSSSSQGNIIFEANGREINFDLDRQTITSGDLEIDYQSKNFEMNVRLLVDIKTIEVYLNDGEINMPLRIDGKIDSESISLTSDMPVNIQELKVRTLRSVWN